MDITIDLNKGFIRPDGTEVRIQKKEDDKEKTLVTLAETLANALTGAPANKDSRDFVIYADDLYKKGIIVLKPSQYDKIWNYLESDEAARRGVTSLMCGRIQNEMSDQRDAQRKKDVE